MAFTVERLEKCLRAWEDFWFLVKVLRALPNEGVVMYAPSFRKQLLKARQKPLDISNFLPSENVQEIKDCWLNNFPRLLAPWSFHSRRIYHITEELQAVLNATSLAGVTWADVQPPFPAFAVRFERPIVDVSEEARCDFVMVSMIPFEGEDGLMVPSIDLMFLPRELDQYQPLIQPNRDNILNRARNGQWEHVHRVCERLMEKFNMPIGYHHLRGKELDMEVVSTAQTILDDDYGDNRSNLESGLYYRIGTVGFWDLVLRILVGMCLYLKTLPSGSPHQSQWRPVPRSGLADPRAINNESQVCTVSSCYKLSTEERVVLGLEGTREQRAAYELCCHFRAGHWRRPPGQGHISDAPKTVHVRPCLVRKDRLQNGQLPGGSKATV